MVILRGEEPFRPAPLLPVHNYIFENAEDNLDKVALVDAVTGVQLTFKQYVDQIEQLASGLWELGVRPGSVVGLFSRNSIQYCIVFFAAIRLGAVVNTANPIYTANELRHQIIDAGVEWIFTSSNMVPTVEKAREGIPRLEEIITLDENNKSYRTYNSLIQNGTLRAPMPKISPRNDLAVIMYSSGTTGRSKGVMTTHYNVVAVVDTLDPIFNKLKPFEQNVLGYLPMYHSFGLIHNLCYSARFGATLIILPGFEPHTFCSTIQKYKIKEIIAVPSTVVFLAKSPIPKQYDLSTIDCIRSGAAPLGQEIIKEVSSMYSAAVGQVFHLGWGLTEATTMGTYYSDFKNPGAVGKVGATVELKVINIESGQELGPGESGELWIRCPGNMKGYLNNPEATANTLTKDGWLKTGDLGYFDTEGDVFVTDRLKELIKVKGYQVAPAELEDLLLTHPDVADAAVVGVPDERSGELPKAFIVKKDGSQESARDIMKYIEGKVAPYKQLRGGVEFISEIPKSPSGKILRRQLRELQAKSKL